MSNVVNLFKGQAGLSDEAMGAIQNMVAASSLSIREELRPIRELLTAMNMQNERLAKAIEAITTKMSTVNAVRMEAPKLKPLPVAKGVSGLRAEKMASEIISMLYEKMDEPHPSRLRPFYTDLEAETGVSIAEKHHRRTENIRRKDVGKFPYRKMDTALMHINHEEVFQYAKAYVFSTR